MHAICALTVVATRVVATIAEGVVLLLRSSTTGTRTRTGKIKPNTGGEHNTVYCTDDRNGTNDSMRRDAP